MDFRTALEHYKAGTESDEERALVENELEKNRLIAEYLEDTWCPPPEPPELSPADPGKVTALLKRHDRKSFLKTTALLGILALLVSCVLIPWAERLYWNPDDTSYDDTQLDIKLVMDAYTELFLPCKTITGIRVTDTGFATYELSLSIHDRSRPDWYDLTATLDQGKLLLHQGFSEDDPTWILPFNKREDYIVEENMRHLDALPEYVTLRAAVIFPEDLNMAQIFSLWTDYTWSDTEYPLTIDWVAVRHQAENSETYLRECGFSFYVSGLDSEINDTYPEFYLWGMNPDGSDLEQHFKSLLKFSSDRCRDNRNVYGVSQTYYDSVLSYVEEHGVMSYGCIVTGSPDAIRNLLDQGIAEQIRILDGWLDIP